MAHGKAGPLTKGNNNRYSPCSDCLMSPCCSRCLFSRLCIGVSLGPRALVTWSVQLASPARREGKGRGVTPATYHSTTPLPPPACVTQHMQTTYHYHVLHSSHL